MAMTPPKPIARGTTVFKGRVFTVQQDRMRLSNGREVTMDVVRHRGSVVLVPQPDATHVILIRQYRYVIGRWLWELPAGSLDEGEAPRRAAARECQEEIGLKPKELVRLAEYFPTPGFCDERMVFYACRQLVTPRTAAHQDLDEQIEPRTFTLRQAWALVKSGAICDMKTVVGLALVSGKVPRPGAK